MKTLALGTLIAVLALAFQLNKAPAAVRDFGSAQFAPSETSGSEGFGLASTISKFKKIRAITLDTKDINGALNEAFPETEKERQAEANRPKFTNESDRMLYEYDQLVKQKEDMASGLNVLLFRLSFVRKAAGL